MAPNLNLGVRDGGSYLPDVFFSKIIDSRVNQEWWIETGAWTRFIEGLEDARSDSLMGIQDDSGLVQRVRTLLNSMAVDLPAAEGVRFPATAVFHRVPRHIKDTLHQMTLVAAARQRAHVRDNSKFLLDVQNLADANLPSYNRLRFENEFAVPWFAGRGARPGPQPVRPPSPPPVDGLDIDGDSDSSSDEDETIAVNP